MSKCLDLLANILMELLLRIEKYPHRMNFNNGVLESRRLHYKHLSKLLVGNLNHIWFHRLF